MPDDSVHPVFFLKIQNNTMKKQLIARGLPDKVLAMITIKAYEIAFNQDWTDATQLEKMTSTNIDIMIEAYMKKLKTLDNTIR